MSFNGNIVQFDYLVLVAVPKTKSEYLISVQNPLRTVGRLPVSVKQQL